MTAEQAEPMKVGSAGTVGNVVGRLQGLPCGPVLTLRIPWCRTAPLMKRFLFHKPCFWRRVDIWPYVFVHFSAFSVVRNMLHTCPNL